MNDLRLPEEIEDDEWRAAADQIIASINAADMSAATVSRLAEDFPLILETWMSQNRLPDDSFGTFQKIINQLKNSLDQLSPLVADMTLATANLNEMLANPADRDPKAIAFSVREMEKQLASFNQHKWQVHWALQEFDSFRIRTNFMPFGFPFTPPPR